MSGIIIIIIIYFELILSKFYWNWLIFENCYWNSLIYEEG